jgi:hypothetical protein
MPVRSSSIETSALDVDEVRLNVLVLTDGSRTEAIISNDATKEDGYLAAGVAKRRKGEKPKPTAAAALATGRALRELAEEYFKQARVNGLPEVKLR